MTSAYNDEENGVERRKTRSARANYVPSMSATALWTEETWALVGVWGADDVQSQLDVVARNKAIFEKITSFLANTIEHGSSAKRRLNT